MYSLLFISVFVTIALTSSVLAADRLHFRFRRANTKTIGSADTSDNTAAPLDPVSPFAASGPVPAEDASYRVRRQDAPSPAGDDAKGDTTPGAAVIKCNSCKGADCADPKGSDCTKTADVELGLKETDDEFILWTEIAKAGADAITKTADYKNCFTVKWEAKNGEAQLRGCGPATFCNAVKTAETTLKLTVDCLTCEMVEGSPCNGDSGNGTETTDNGATAIKVHTNILGGLVTLILAKFVL